jgi:hypothetical protein
MNHSMQSAKHALVMSIVQVMTLVFVSISRVITSATALQNVARLLGASSGFLTSHTFYCLIFGAVEMLLSLIPSLEDASWVSGAGTAASMTYLTITIVLSLLKAGNRGGSLWGRDANAASKAFNVLSSVGNIMQSYNCAQMIMEIEVSQLQRISTAISVCCLFSVSESRLHDRKQLYVVPVTSWQSSLRAQHVLLRALCLHLHRILCTSRHQPQSR